MAARGPCAVRREDRPVTWTDLSYPHAGERTRTQVANMLGAELALEFGTARGSLLRLRGGRIELTR
jgi:hypothetical protein